MTFSEDSADTWAPEIQLVSDKDTYKAFLVTDSKMSNDVSEMLKTNSPAHDAPMALMTTSNTFTLPSAIGNLQSR